MRSSANKFTKIWRCIIHTSCNWASTDIVVFSSMFVQCDRFPNRLTVCQKVQLMVIDTSHYIHVYTAYTVFGTWLHTLLNQSQAVVAVFNVIFSTEWSILVPDTLSVKVQWVKFWTQHNINWKYKHKIAQVHRQLVYLINAHRICGVCGITCMCRNTVSTT